jgi:hypothetical protein
MAKKAMKRSESERTLTSTCSDGAARIGRPRAVAEATRHAYEAVSRVVGELG